MRVGSIRQDPSIAATIRVDDLLGKHFAILGTTGTGKSCTTALILRSIPQRNPAAHILLLDPHNQYASSFGAWGEVISPRNMQLPYWLLTFEELIEVLIGNPQERKAEIEILQELIPLAKCRTIYDSMAQSLGRMFRVPVNSKPITMLELTGLPTESVNVVVSVRCRMTFDFALCSEGQVPVTLVCEQAHRYVPTNPSFGFEPCKRAIAKIAKEGRKYGASLCIVTQRPAEIDPTILSHRHTVFALRMSNDRDQEIVKSAIADTGAGLLEFPSALGQREAIAFGDGVTLPVRIKFDELPAHAMPRSSSAPFTEMWQKPVGDEGFLDSTVDRWRNASASAADAVQSASLKASTCRRNVAGPPAPAVLRGPAHALAREPC